jgi:RNA polymerase sigma-70 factor (ECF subfamily)
MGGALPHGQPRQGRSAADLADARLSGMAEGDARVAQATAEMVARRSYGKLVAFLAARTRDVAAAEDALAEAFASALTHWPMRGVPDNPEGWLIAAARRKAIDAHRTARRGAEASPHLTLLAEELAMDPVTEIPDERLKLLFACAHPAIDETVRAPLMLQAVLGFDAAAIASAFLVSPAAMSQRLVRAKSKIRESGIPFRVPEREDLAERLPFVLDAIYAAYAEGWSDPAGTDASQREMATEAIWLGRLAAMLLPDEAEAQGLLALMLHSQARRAARRDASGEFVPLSEQDTGLWDGAMMTEAEALLRRAAALHAIGRFQLEAAVQSAHAIRCLNGATDWAAIVTLYDALWAMTGSPVIAINRAIAIAETQGATAGLEALDALDMRALSQYQPYWSARAHLLAGAGAHEEARTAYDRAIGLEIDPAVRRFLQAKQAALPLH